MSSDEEPTIVVFRKWNPNGAGRILALFPEVPSDNYGQHCLSYEHVGQHSGAWYLGCITHSRPAKPEEYATLHRELTRRGYKLIVRTRATQAMHDKRRRVAAAARASVACEAVTSPVFGYVPDALVEDAAPAVREPVLRRLEFDDFIDE